MYEGSAFRFQRCCTNPQICNPFQQHGYTQVLTSEEMFGLFRVARNVLNPFRELCTELVPRLLL